MRPQRSYGSKTASRKSWRAEFSRWLSTATPEGLERVSAEEWARRTGYPLATAAAMLDGARKGRSA